MEGAPPCESCVWRRAATPHFLLACAPRVCLAVSGAPLRGGPWALGAGAAADEGVDAWPGRAGGGGDVPLSWGSGPRPSLWDWG